MVPECIDYANNKFNTNINKLTQSKFLLKDINLFNVFSKKHNIEEYLNKEISEIENICYQNNYNCDKENLDKLNILKNFKNKEENLYLSLQMFITGIILLITCIIFGAINFFNNKSENKLENKLENKSSNIKDIYNSKTNMYTGPYPVPRVEVPVFNNSNSILGGKKKIFIKKNIYKK